MGSNRRQRLKAVVLPHKSVDTHLNYSKSSQEIPKIWRNMLCLDMLCVTKAEREKCVQDKTYIYNVNVHLCINDACSRARRFS